MVSTSTLKTYTYCPYTSKDTVCTEGHTSCVWVKNTHFLIWVVRPKMSTTCGISTKMSTLLEGIYSAEGNTTSILHL